MTGCEAPEKDSGADILVSVIIPVYNSSAFIAETLDSIVEQKLPGSGMRLEIIAVDDGSTDDSVDTIRNYVNNRNRREREKRSQKPSVIRILENNRKKGAAGARNTGIAAAGGRYIAFIDSDDIWAEDKLSGQIAFMQERRCAFSFTGYEFADEEGRGTGKIVRVPDVISYREALKNTTIFTSTVMFDMEKLEKDDILFPFVESEDTANWWKVLRNKGDACGLDKPLTLYRRSAGTLSSKMTAVRRIWRLYRRVEKLSLPYSIYCFCWYALRAVKRRV